MAKKSFVRHLRTGTKGGRWVVSFQLEGLREDGQSLLLELECPSGLETDDQASREGFRLLRQRLLQEMRSANAEESPWLHRRLMEILASLESERARVLREK